MPHIALFPDNPARDPVVFIHDTIEVYKQVQDIVLATQEVKAALAQLAQGDSTFFSPWSNAKGFTSSIQAADKKFVLHGQYELNGLNTKQMQAFLDGYVSRIALLNRHLERENRIEYSKVYDRETSQAAKAQKALFKKTYTEINDKATFMTLVGWQLNTTNQLEEPLSTLGHWEYENVDASDEENVFVEVINYGSHYKMIYFIEYSDDFTEAQLEAMYTQMNTYIVPKIPKGADSIDVVSSPYTNMAAIELTYSLQSGIKGKAIYKHAELFDKFIKKTYKKINRLAGW